MNIANIYFNIVSLLGSLAVFIIGTVVFYGDRKNKTSKLWFFSCVFAALWSLFFFLIINSSSKEVSSLLRVFMDASAILIMYYWLRFVVSFLGTNNKKILRGALICTLVILVLNMTPWFAKDMVPKYIFRYYVEASWGYYLFALYFMAIATMGLSLLYKEKNTSNGVRYTQIRSVLNGSLVGMIGGGSSFLLSFNLPIPPYLFILFAALPVIIGRGIVKYHLFNVKVIASELFAIAIGIFLTIRLILSETQNDIVINAILLTAVIVFGSLLIRSIKNEVSQREKIEELAKDLSKTNDNLKVANEKLKELDRQKTEFVSIASHQLRSPLTAIKGYSSMLLEGSFGPVEERAKGAVDVIFQSSQRLMTVIEDFLNITRIELGKMKYDISVFDLGALAQTVVKDQEPNVKKRGLTIEFADGTGNHQVSADNGKVAQVISNVIDNSIKYTPSGSVKVTVENLPAGKSKTKENVRLTVIDTGVGIDPATLTKLFDKFVRADDAGKTNISGTGLGLYVAKQIVEGLGGKIWAESEGKGHGSRFIVEFPRSDKPVPVALDHKIESYTKADLKKLQAEGK
jgi:signal transduction histidine kinase